MMDKKPRNQNRSIKLNFNHFQTGPILKLEETWANHNQQRKTAFIKSASNQNQVMYNHQGNRKFQPVFSASKRKQGILTLSSPNIEKNKNKQITIQGKSPHVKLVINISDEEEKNQFYKRQNQKSNKSLRRYIKGANNTNSEFPIVKKHKNIQCQKTENSNSLITRKYIQNPNLDSTQIAEKNRRQINNKIEENSTNCEFYLQNYNNKTLKIFKTENENLKGERKLLSQKSVNLLKQNQNLQKENQKVIEELNKLEQKIKRSKQTFGFSINQQIEINLSAGLNYEQKTKQLSNSTIKGQIKDQMITEMKYTIISQQNIITELQNKIALINKQKVGKSRYYQL